MNIIGLRRINKYEFKRNAILNTEPDVKKWLQNPSNFKLAVKCSDGQYNCVHSEISDFLASTDALGVRLKAIIAELIPSDPIHGQRFILYENGKEVFLLGTVETAMMLLAQGQ